MSHIAQIKDGVVVNVIVAELEWAQEYASAGFDAVVPAGDAGPGWTWDGETFTAPPEPEPEPEPTLPRHITRLAFRNRFTQAELVTLEIAGLDDPSAPMAQRQLAASVRVMQRQVGEATYIDLDRADTRAGVQQLEAAGLLAAGRALAILDAEIQDIERPK